MGKNWIRNLWIVIPLLAALTVQGQEKAGNVEMAETMRSNGKIYVVVAVCLTILIGLILYVIRLDRKISKLEKEKA
jgi:hypothetical protein